MTAPQDPYDGPRPDAPRYDPYGPRAPYNPAQGDYGQPYGSYAQPTAGYDPYGNQPAGLGGAPETPSAPATRPPLMTVALVLCALTALVWIVLGLAAATSVTPALVNEQVQATGAELGGLQLDQIVAAVQALGWGMVVVALVYLGVAVLAFCRQRWARIVLAVLTGVFAVLLLVGLVGGSDSGSAAMLVALIAAPVAAVVLMFRPAVTAWFAGRPR